MGGYGRSGGGEFMGRFSVRGRGWLVDVGRRGEGIVLLE